MTEDLLVDGLLDGAKPVKDLWNPVLLPTFKILHRAINLTELSMQDHEHIESPEKPSISNALFISGRKNTPFVFSPIDVVRDWFASTMAATSIVIPQRTSWRAASGIELLKHQKAWNTKYFV